MRLLEHPGFSRVFGIFLRMIYLATISLLTVSCSLMGDDEKREGQGGRGVADGPPPVSSSAGVRKAVVDIYGPEAGGSGFIVDPSGIVVTNNHVVAGARDLEVYVGGEGEPRRAEKMGVSECSDLAVLDMEGGGFPYLAFREGETEAGLSVNAAGFPGAGRDNEPTYSQTGGQVTRPKAPGDSGLASVEHVIQHDAPLEGGNSGGPLVDEGGRVVGVNFGGPNDEEGNPTDQMWAIPAGETRELLPALRRRENVGAVGVTGRALLDAQTGVRGVYVRAVEEGSPAGKAGVRTGDLIQKLGGTDVAVKGTKQEYCDVLRGRDGGAQEEPLPVRVRRGEEAGEYLEGEIGGEPLKPTGEADRIVGDDSGVLVVWVPTEWERTRGAPTAFPAARAKADATVQASSDPERGFTIDDPGVAFSASRQLAERYTAEEFLNLWSFSEGCRNVRREPYDDGFFAGMQDRYTGCGQGGTENTVVAATPEGGEYMVVVNVVTAPDETGARARDLILGSFRVGGLGPAR